MGYARVRVSEQLLLDVLHFPKGTVVKHVESFYGNGYCDAELYIAHPDLKEPSCEGEVAPLVTPVFERHDGVTLMVDWGQK